jgi:hypothetical protein
MRRKLPASAGFCDRGALHQFLRRGRGAPAPNGSRHARIGKKRPTLSGHRNPPQNLLDKVSIGPDTWKRFHLSIRSPGDLHRTNLGNPQHRFARKKAFVQKEEVTNEEYVDRPCSRDVMSGFKRHLTEYVSKRKWSGSKRQWSGGKLPPQLSTSRSHRYCVRSEL